MHWINENQGPGKNLPFSTFTNDHLGKSALKIKCKGSGGSYKNPIFERAMLELFFYQKECYNGFLTCGMNAKYLNDHILFNVIKDEFSVNMMFKLQWL